MTRRKTMRIRRPVRVVAAASVFVLAAGFAMAHCGACGMDAKKPEKKNDACAGGVCAAGAVKVEAARAEVKEKVPTLGVEELATLIRAKTPVVILDARAGKWDDGRRIPGARSLNAGSSKEEVEAAIPDKGALVVTYCANTKCQASPKLAAHLKALGYSNVMELPEGIDGWQAAGKEVRKDAK
jgi:rhodanese-related sulfurtransferase